jgi:DNA-directed RNA polymerase subunit beta
LARRSFKRESNFDVRDVHYSHYGRNVSYRDPEGPNMPYLLSASYARVNEYGFLVTPFRKVEKGTCRVTDEVQYLTAT